jgi:hypothetical protein
MYVKFYVIASTIGWSWNHKFKKEQGTNPQENSIPTKPKNASQHATLRQTATASSVVDQEATETTAKDLFPQILRRQ